MARLITLQQITQEKIGRKRAWIWNSVAAGDFPAPVVRSGKALWAEDEVDKWLVDFVAKAKAKETEKNSSSSRTAQARKARTSRRTQMAAAA